MSATRLLVLGVVRLSGRTHGYQVRRELQNWGAEYWANVQPGSVYHALKKMAREGLLAEVATEESAEGPGRVIYELTEEGETEFQRLLGDSISRIEVGRDPALVNAAATFITALPRRTAISLFRYRLAALEGVLANAERSVAENDLMGKPEHVRELFRLWQYHADADVRWTRELIETLEAGGYVMADDSPDHFGHRAT